MTDATDLAKRLRNAALNLDSQKHPKTVAVIHEAADALDSQYESLKDKEPKESKAWAVFDPHGKIVDGTVTQSRADSVRMYCMLPSRWPKFKKLGYTCRRIVIRPLAKGE